MEKEELLQVYRHSLAHILAKAVIEIYGKEVQYGIGPQIEDGCYYDFVLPEGKSIGEEDFKAIENKMREIIKRREPWTRKEVSKAEAKEIFKDQKFKLELIEELRREEEARELAGGREISAMSNDGLSMSFTAQGDAGGDSARQNRILRAWLGDELSSGGVNLLYAGTDA